MPPIKLLFGLRVSETTTLTVTYEPDEDDDPPPPLTVHKQGNAAATTNYDDINAKWEVVLTAGDHTVRLECPEDEWFYNIPQFVTDESAVVVYHWDNYGHSSYYTRWWNERESSAGGLNGQDPKDPWPPPDGNLTLDNPTWILDQLETLGKTIENPRSGPPRPARPGKPKPRARGMAPGPTRPAYETRRHRRAGK